MKVWLAVVAIMLALVPTSAQAADLSVSPTGNDTGACTTLTPCRTLDRAYHQAAQGDTVTLTGGSYPAQTINADASKTGVGQVTFQPALGAAPTFTAGVTVGGSHVAFTSLTFTNPGSKKNGSSAHCITLRSGLVDITVRSSTIRSCGSSGIRFTRTGTLTRDVTVSDNTISDTGTIDQYGNALTIYASNLLVEGNDITRVGNDAINMWGDHHTYRANRIHDITPRNRQHDDAWQTWTGLNDGAEGPPVTGLVIERNRVERVNSGNAHCVMAEGPGHRDWTIRDNLFVDVGDQCMIIGKTGNGTQGVQALTVAGNTFVRAGANNTVELNLSSSGVVASNLFQDCRGWGSSGPVFYGASSSFTHDYNLASGTTTRIAEPHAINQPALLAADYQLTAGSPAIDRGDNGVLVPVRAVDLAGQPTVGAVDIGAFEHPGG